MKPTAMLCATFALSLVSYQATESSVRASEQAPAAIAGQVTSAPEGSMEGVVVTAHKDGSIVSVSVTTDAKGHYAFPENRLEPGHYTLAIRAVGYDLAAPTATDVVSEQNSNVDLKLVPTKDLANQLTDAEWMMSIPGTDDQKAALLNCTSCHTLERVVLSTHNTDEWMQVVQRMMSYGAVSQPVKPQPMLDKTRAGTPEQYSKLAEYLATINLSSVDKWTYPLKTLPRPTGDSTRVIVTEYNLPRSTIEPHDIVRDTDGNVWYTDFGEMFVSKFDPKTLKLTEYPIKTFKPDAPVGLLSLAFDKEGMLW
ncbi:MAG: carboxypeptidase regulatory-like domain-containing protein, partial [Xanthobacteraceae bacterium]